MNVGTLKQSINEAERFIKIAKQVGIKEITGTHAMAGKKWLRAVDYTKESAACRRASMDLTRVLSKLRNEQ